MSCHRSENVLVVDFGFGEQNVPFMVFFRHLALLLFANVFLVCAVCDSKPISLLSLCGS